MSTSELFRSFDFLEAILDSDTPTRHPVRFTKTLALIYGFVDASGRGFAGTFEQVGKNEIEVDLGTWSSETENDRTSNWKEFGNLVERTEARAERGDLTGAVLFLFTDSSTVEGAVDKGNSTSKELFKLVCKLRKLQMKHSFALYVIHVAGTRMIEQGTDGLSRGVLNR